MSATRSFECVNGTNWVPFEATPPNSSVMVPVGKYLPPLTLTRCHNDSLRVALCTMCFCVHITLHLCLWACICVAAQSPPTFPLHSCSSAELINNASFILKSGLTLAAFCLLPGARVRMYRLENKALKKKEKSLEIKESPPHCLHTTAFSLRA